MTKMCGWIGQVPAPLAQKVLLNTSQKVVCHKEAGLTVLKRLVIFKVRLVILQSQSVILQVTLVGHL